MTLFPPGLTHSFTRQTIILPNPKPNPNPYPYSYTYLPLTLSLVSLRSQSRIGLLCSQSRLVSLRLQSRLANSQFRFARSLASLPTLAVTRFTRNHSLRSHSLVSLARLVPACIFTAIKVPTNRVLNLPACFTVDTFDYSTTPGCVDTLGIVLYVVL